jgi:hypothetical protein
MDDALERDEAERYLPKPLKIEDLIETLNGLIEVQSGASNINH